MSLASTLFLYWLILIKVRSGKGGNKPPSPPDSATSVGPPLMSLHCCRDVSTETVLQHSEPWCNMGRIQLKLCYRWEFRTNLTGYFTKHSKNPHSIVWIYQFCAPSTFPVTPIHRTQTWWSVDNSVPLLTQVSSKYGQRSDETIPKLIIDLLLRPSLEPYAGTWC